MKNTALLATLLAVAAAASGSAAPTASGFHLAITDTARHFIMLDEPEWTFAQIEAFLAATNSCTDPGSEANHIRAEQQDRLPRKPEQGTGTHSSGGETA